MLKKALQVSCPSQLNGINCGLIQVIICLHINDGAQIDPTTCSQYAIPTERKMLPSMLVQNRNKRQHYIRHLFPHLKTSWPSELPDDRTIPMSPSGRVELPSTNEWIVGGKVLDTITVNTACSWKKPHFTAYSTLCPVKMMITLMYHRQQLGVLMMML